jgi:hypothetical protein
MPRALPHRPHEAEWRELIGRAITCFGEIEFVSIKCLAYIPQDRFSGSVGGLDFAKRVDILIELLEGRQSLDPNLRGLLRGFIRAKSLAKTRNLIAHNPLMFDIYVNDDASKVILEQSITSTRSGAKRIKLDQLRIFADEVESLAGQLWGHFAKVERRKVERSPNSLRRRDDLPSEPGRSAARNGKSSSALRGRP